MNIDNIKLTQKNNLMIDYQNNEDEIMQFFDYHPFDDYKERLQYLRHKTFQRDRLVNTLLAMNKQWGAPDQTIRNINKLTDTESVVVVGGQQAGLLTGPLYTLNKIISIIKFAKEQEEKLQVPVIPMFWIAGEDHDFDEINHIHLFNLTDMKKHQIAHYTDEGLPVSDIQLDQQITKQWIDDVFSNLKEAETTKELYDSVKKCLEQSTTYVDFFARLLFALFEEEGLVLIDSNDSHIRKIESEYFKQLIVNQEQLAADMLLSAQKIKQKGYPLSLEIEAKDAHLFYHHHGERILLQRTSDNYWEGKQGEVQLTTDQLMRIAQNEPELLSNNVVTRPLMQELLLPTLAFIGGWGEISYWAVLKNAFHLLDLKMPPVVPRLSFSFVDQKTTKILKKYGIASESVINNGVRQRRANWLAAKYNPPIEELARQIKEDIFEVHKPLRTIAKQITTDVGQIADRNVFYLQKEIDFLVNRMKRAVQEQYDHELNEFAIAEQVLHPNGNLQERIWNPIYLINTVGKDFISHLIHTPLSFKNDHYVIFL